MQWLNRVPIWGWALFTLVLVYATWNPTGYSMTEYVMWSDGRRAVRFFVAVVLLAVYAFYLHETFLTFNYKGAIIFVLFVAGVLWLAVDFGVLSAASTGAWRWLAPGIFALLLTVGLQGNRIYRNATGRVPVSVDHHGHDGHAVPDQEEHRG